MSTWNFEESTHNWRKQGISFTTQPTYFRSLDSSVTEPTGNELAKATFPSRGSVPNKPNNPVYLNNVRPEIQAVSVHVFPHPP